MITSFESLAERRLITLNYHKKDSQQYINSLNYFEYARIYFEKMAFQKITEEFIKVANERSKVGWSDKEEKQQKEDIRKFIYEKQLQKFKGRRKS